MRIVKELSKPPLKITFYHWNNRYLIKLEQGPFEQTFKVDQFELASEQQLEQLLTDSFLAQAKHRFDEMAQSLGEALANL